MAITVRDLIAQLKKEDQDLEIYFGGLELYRLRERGDCLQFEFNQSVYLNDEGMVVVENHQLSQERRNNPKLMKK